MDYRIVGGDVTDGGVECYRQINIGKQVMYEVQNEYSFEDDKVKDYIYCPYCAHKFNKERIFQA